MAKDKDYRLMIHSSRWVRLRRSVLSEYPLCRNCKDEGYISAATEVHHRIPVEQGVNYVEKTRLMFNRSNLVPLCHECHVKVHTEMGRSGKEATKRRNSEHLSRIKQRFFGD